MWGQEKGDAFIVDGYRIIPTRVGTRSYFFMVYEWKEDHPHACGDKTKEIKENSGFAKSTA